MTVPSLSSNEAARRLAMVRSATRLPPDRKPTPAREVTDRVLLAEGFVVSVKVPTKRDAKTVPVTGEAYEQFGFSVKGGYLNFHLYDGANCQWRGERIWVSAQVFEKTMEDGMKFIYVDLRPTDAEHLTHEMKVYYDTGTMPDVRPDQSTTFGCRDMVEGVLAFLPLRATNR